jgi:hypothetical protein
VPFHETGAVILTDPLATAFGSTVDTSVFTAVGGGTSDGDPGAGDASNHIAGLTHDDMEEDDAELMDDDEGEGYAVLPK